MPIAFAVVLEEGAKALATAFGKELAKQFANFLFGTLATKDDIRQAIRELEAFIDQRIDQLEDNLEDAGLLAARTQLEDYSATHDPAILAAAYNSITQSISFFRARSADDPAFDRTHVVALLKMINTDIGVWIFRCTRTAQPDPHNRDVLRDRCTNHALWLENTIRSIEQYQAESVTDVRIQLTDASAPYDPPGPRPPRLTECDASFDVVGARYAGGRRTVSKSALDDLAGVRNYIDNARAGEMARIQNEATQRDTQIVQPANRYIDALRKLAQTLSP
ncbi:hypothetical protein LMG27952_06719 [Paraburkholderia hiiakae]|uniref:Uncharacterized protein n=1 Tax=Paraburkholderia hiiakae TaxID=1081782 RepID=A0ABN7IFM5_9BURK|nr:hypothetical protein [Paraburkholderia hiiakae]CAD6558814.1 hypothetical protein LMG27952_06719 [Paraburkholderia hiiakae]